eukprot:GSChrysophyteH2.ASY1.ANO1.543.1 assembled CDS
MSARVGFVGLGIMGKGMLTNLATKLSGVETFVVWNRSQAVCKEFEDAFPGKIEIADTAAEVVQKCSITYSMLSTIDASIAVFDKADTGLIAGITEGKTVIDCATLSPERMQDIETAILAKGGKFLEAPVSGSKVPAATGTLIFLCAGNEAVFADEEVTAALNAMGKASHFLGAVGAASRMKLVVNSLMGTMMNAFTEGTCRKV